MKKSLILFMTTSSIGLFGCELLKESKNDEVLKDNVVSSENQQSETVPPSLSQQELNELWIKDLKSSVLIYWNGTINKWVELDVKDSGYFEEILNATFIAGKAKTFKTYNFSEAISPARAVYTYNHFYVMDATPSQSNSLGNYKVTLEFFPSKIANTREVLMKTFSDGYQSDIAYRR